MSVKTTADELIDNMRKDVIEALKTTNKAFTEIVVLNDCWGSDEYTEEFKQKIARAQRELLEIRQMLGDRKYFD